MAENKYTFPIVYDDDLQLAKELEISSIPVIYENLEELEKELDKKIMFYDAKLDLDKIRKDMEAKGMKVSDEVVYFEIEE